MLGPDRRRFRTLCVGLSVSLRHERLKQSKTDNYEILTDNMDMIGYVYVCDVRMFVHVGVSSSNLCGSVVRLLVKFGLVRFGCLFDCLSFCLPIGVLVGERLSGLVAQLVSQT